MHENVTSESNIHVHIYKENICFLNGEGAKSSKPLTRFFKLLTNPTAF